MKQSAKEANVPSYKNDNTDVNSLVNDLSGLPGMAPMVKSEIDY